MKHKSRARVGTLRKKEVGTLSVIKYKGDLGSSERVGCLCIICELCGFNCALSLLLRLKPVSQNVI